MIWVTTSKMKKHWWITNHVYTSLCLYGMIVFMWLCTFTGARVYERVRAFHGRGRFNLHFSFNIESFIYPPRSREYLWKSGQKTLIHSCRMGKSAVETVWLLHAWPHCCCGYLHHILLNLEPIQFNPATWPVNTRDLFPSALELQPCACCAWGSH